MLYRGFQILETVMPFVYAYVQPFLGVMLIAYTLHLLNYLLWGKQHV